MCLNGQIESAAKLGREWAIPIAAERSKDGRVIWRIHELEKKANGQMMFAKSNTVWREKCMSVIVVVCAA